MYFQYFNPKTSDPRNYFWFNNFVPDIDFQCPDMLLNTIKKYSIAIEKELIPKADFDLIVSNVLNARVHYISKKDINLLFGTINKLLKTDKNINIHSIQIRFDNGEKYIFIKGSFIKIQAYYNLQYYIYNRKKYLNYEHYEREYVSRIFDEFLMFSMDEYNRMQDLKNKIQH